MAPGVMLLPSELVWGWEAIFSPLDGQQLKQAQERKEPPTLRVFSTALFSVQLTLSHHLPT